LILKSRIINEESPENTFNEAENFFGSFKNKKIALLGVAYRFNSEDTRNSPTLALANYLRLRGYDYIMHDPYVKNDDQNLLRYQQQDFFTQDIEKALQDIDYIFMCTSHKKYIDYAPDIINSGKSIKGIVDACNIYQAQMFESSQIKYIGIGRGKEAPGDAFISFVFNSFTAMEKGLSNELSNLIDFYNSNYAFDEFNKVKFLDVQRLAHTCSTGCEIVNKGTVDKVPEFHGFYSELAKNAISIK